SLAAVFGMLFLNGLPRLHHPLFHSKPFEKVTDDRFFIVIEAQDKLFDVDKTRELLEKTQAVTIELLEES
ncbi:MAG: DUF3341 domain-containing protein, partial [Deltaproteobacteria bacterium]|nr:DUF3341 domain-containing protein [Deltaproteobacteria bacterium]